MERFALFVLIVGINGAASEHSIQLPIATMQSSALRAATHEDWEIFIQAVQANDIAQVKKMLDSGVSPKSKILAYDVKTFMSEAIFHERLEIVSCLLDAGENIDGYDARYSWLEYAMMWNKLDIFNYLIDRGISVTKTSAVSCAVKVALYADEVLPSMTKDRVNMVKKLIKLNPRISSHYWWDGCRRADKLDALKKKLSNCANLLETLKKEVQAEGRVAKSKLSAFLIVSRRGSSQPSRLPELVKTELVKYVLSVD